MPKYADAVEDGKLRICPLEGGCRRLIAQSTKLIRELGGQRQVFWKMAKELSDEVNKLSDMRVPSKLGLGLLAVWSFVSYMSCWSLLWQTTCSCQDPVHSWNNLCLRSHVIHQVNKQIEICCCFLAFYDKLLLQHCFTKAISTPEVMPSHMLIVGKEKS